MNANFGRNLALWVIIGLFSLILFNLFQGQNSQSGRHIVEYSQFVAETREGHVVEVDIRNGIIQGKLSDGRHFTTYVPDDVQLADNLSAQGIKVTSAPREQGASLLQVLLSWFPMLLLIGVWIFFLRQMQSGSNRAMGFGKSRARELNEDSKGRVTFAEVAGVDEAKEDVQEVVDFLREPQKFLNLGAKIPKGILLVGPPGTGKTLLARAIAGEAEVPFFTISGSDFVEMFVGVGASRVRDMFEQAKKKSPCIVFIDEIDAVGRHRGAGVGGGNDEREQTLNQLLVEMDGFDNTTCVILVAATNRPDILDPALLRPGRFDRQVVVPVPDVAGREAILKIHGAKVPLTKDVDLKTVARGTPGFSGADLENLVNEAALLAARRNRRSVSMKEMEGAKDKILMGAERKMVMTEEEKKLTAYHEAGHAVVAFNSAASDPIHKATIIPRGRALGMVVRLPEGDQLSLPLKKIKADLAVAMGGRVAEEITFGSECVTTGASSDIRFATDMARRAVTQWGLSDVLGPVQYGSAESQEVFLGHSVTQSRNMSEQTAQMVDAEIRSMVDVAYQEARRILTQKGDQLSLLAEALLEYETLSGEQITQILAGESLDIPRDTPQKPSTPKRSLPSVPSSTKKPTAKSVKPAPQTEG